MVGQHRVELETKRRERGERAARQRALAEHRKREEAWAQAHAARRKVFEQQQRERREREQRRAEGLRKKVSYCVSRLFFRNVRFVTTCYLSLTACVRTPVRFASFRLKAVAR